jgi:hypothetical protein
MTRIRIWCRVLTRIRMGARTRLPWRSRASAEGQRWSRGRPVVGSVGAGPFRVEGRTPHSSTGPQDAGCEGSGSSAAQPAGARSRVRAV